MTDNKIGYDVQEIINRLDPQLHQCPICKVWVDIKSMWFNPRRFKDIEFKECCSDCKVNNPARKIANRKIKDAHRRIRS